MCEREYVTQANIKIVTVINPLTHYQHIESNLPGCSLGNETDGMYLIFAAAPELTDADPLLTSILHTSKMTDRPLFQKTKSGVVD